MDSLQNIKDEIEKKTNPGDRLIKGIWSIDCLYNPAGNGRIFNYKILLTQTSGLGCAYSTHTDYPVGMLESYIGRDILDIKITDVPMLVSMYDSCYAGACEVKPAYTAEAGGVSEKKMRWRSEIIIAEAKRILGNLKGKRVVNVGVVGDIIRVFQESGADVCGTDFDAAIVGKRMFDAVDVYDGKDTLGLVKEANLCVVTGMTVATRTIDAIIEHCNQCGSKIIMFAETGANLGGYYSAHGVDVYLGETFPFYIFNGRSEISVYKK
ncbi:MAG: DUF364 domain-containing protein [Defluviitaleaceae bacterium]|nr:DUF364 domain-containing protein [Defluviitaleaceae bacterium]